jgi:hypothetical protein
MIETCLAETDLLACWRCLESGLTVTLALIEMDRRLLSTRIKT